MTTLIDFTPSQQAPPFSFQPTLDGVQYAATVTWNTWGQRWYLNLTTLSGTPVFTLPLVGSADYTDLLSIAWASGIVTAISNGPHGFQVGATVTVEIEDASPSAYNGSWQAYVVDPVTLQFQLQQYPGPTTAAGAVGFDVDLAGGYFTASTLVYRIANMQIEVNP